MKSAVLNFIQPLSFLLPVMIFVGGAMGQSGPPAPFPDRHTRISGNKSALEREDAMFIDFTGSIRKDYSSPFLYQPSKLQCSKAEGKRVHWIVDDYDLELIEYGISDPPGVEDGSSTTFWKTKDHLYFVMVMGGLAGWPRLVGPFRLKGDTFVFAGKP